MDNVMALKNRVMRRIYLIWFARKIARPVVVELSLFVAAVSAVAYHISCFQVLKNAFNSSESFFTIHKFFLNNFMLAHWFHEVLILGTLAVTILLFWELFRKKESRTTVLAS